MHSLFKPDPPTMPTETEIVAMLERRMALFGLMPDAARRDLVRFIPGFLKDKTFYGQYGLQVDTEMRVLVAAGAALVGMYQPVGFFRATRWILLYPDLVDLDGEAFGVSKVVLSWQQVREESEEIFYGCNLCVHEFAHIMDHMLGISGGTRALRRGYDQFCERAGRGLPSVLSEEAREGPEEFFSIASEAFFSAPLHLRDEDPALYADLQRLYGMDTAEWIPPFEEGVEF